MAEHGDTAVQRFARLEVLLDAAMDLPRAERQAWLEAHCADADLRREALELLRAVDASTGFMEEEALPTLPTAERIGPWRLVRCIGRGGMGEVWLGQRDDGRFEQQVAIKLLRRRGGDVARFGHEQRLLARLQHPNIARLIDAGNLGDGRPYMVMEYIDGVPLVQHCRDLGLRGRLALFAQLCDAVAFAHRHLVVHRDLKPDNVLVRPDGHVALLDFGIAQLLDGNTPDSGPLRLTPRYAAPEQLAGAAPTTLTDVYALGLVLHELLCDQSPWGTLGDSVPAALLLREQQPPPPSAQAASPLRARRLRGDLDAIVAKALQNEPGARYASVEALAEDVQRHLGHAPVQARGRAPLYRAARLLRRHWLAAGATLLVFAALTGALTAVSLARRDALRERDTARTEAARSKAVRDYLAHMFRDASDHAREGGTLSAKQVLKGAAARIDADFATAPADHAEVLKALGELNFYIDDYAAAEPLLRRWLEREAAIGDPIAAADVRFTLAETVHRMGRADEARALLAAAQDYWTADPVRHANVLLTSRMLQARLQREAGDPAGAIATLEQALGQRLAHSGRVDFETAALYTNLGATYGQVGRIDDGITASRAALGLWRELRLESGNDALNTLNNLAALHFRSGDYVAAESRFREALALRRDLYGPSAATAALIGNYARTLQRLDREAEALDHAAEAETMALAHAGPASTLTQAARVTEAELLLALGRDHDAAAVLARFGAEDPAALPAALRLRGAVAQARVHQRDGDDAAARMQLQAAESLLAEAGGEAMQLQPQIDALRSALQP